MTDTAEEALDLCNEIEEAINMVPEEKEAKAEEFLYSVSDKVQGIRVNVEDYQSATEGQLQALRNMLEGVEAWM